MTKYNLDFIDMIVRELSQIRYNGYNPDILRVYPLFFSVLKHKLRDYNIYQEDRSDNYFYGLHIIIDQNLNVAWRIE